MPDSAKHSVSVGAAIIEADGRALVVRRRDNGRWEPPGGVLELAESIEAGLAREVREETGLDVEIEMLTGAYKNLPRGIVALVFRCRVVNGILTPNDEADGFAWLDRDEITTTLPEAYAVRLTDAMDYAGSVAVRVHDGTRLLSVS
jgi:8-oxo-dGTP diphosphatase